MRLVLSFLPLLHLYIYDLDPTPIIQLFVLFNFFINLSLFVSFCLELLLSLVILTLFFQCFLHYFISLNNFFLHFIELLQQFFLLLSLLSFSFFLFIQLLKQLCFLTLLELFIFFYFLLHFSTFSYFTLF